MQTSTTDKTTKTNDRAESRPTRKAIWVRKFSSFEEADRAERDDWSRMAPAERVEAVETLRSEWWEQHGGGEQRLRRAVRVLATL